MKLKLITFDKWDESFFKSFVNFKKALQGHLITYFPENLEDYKKFFHPDSVFSSDITWKGFLVLSDEAVVAKAILVNQKGNLVGNLGFIDWIDHEEIARYLISAVEATAKEWGLKEIKTPVDVNFFVKYRIRCPGGGEPYYGEPIYPDYYHKLFNCCGYNVVGTWDTYQIKRLGTFLSLAKKRKMLKTRKHPHTEKVNVRLLNLSDWDNELKIVYELFLKSFSGMPEFQPINFDQFKLLYDDFKYIAHPLLSYIVELKGTPIGFSINYPDPLETLARVKDKKLSKFDKILLLIKLRLNFKTLLMPYMGKVPGPNGEDVKGVFLKVSKLLTRGVLVSGKSLICYQSPDSPSRRPMDPDLLKEYAKYVLYGKKLE